MNKAETGESSLDDTVAVPANEVAQLISLHLTSEKQFTPVTVEKRTVYWVYQHRPQPAEADVGWRQGDHGQPGHEVHRGHGEHQAGVAADLHRKQSFV